MAASSGGMNGVLENSYNLPNGVHMFDFKFPTEESSENLSYFITNELVRHFGNPAYYTDKRSDANISRSSTGTTTGASDFVKNKDENELRDINVHHRVLDITKGDNVLQTAMNRKYICILLEDGSVQRASCRSTGNVGIAGKSATGNSSSSWVESQNFQVASDESYARALYRGLNSDRLNLLAGRRSYLGRSSIHSAGLAGQRGTGLQVHSSGPSSTFSLPQPREFFSLQRVSPTFRTTRYVPYDRDSRPNRRHIQMGHLLNIPTVNVPANPRTVVFAANGDEEMGQSLVSLPDNPQSSHIDILNDNITIVSLEDANDQPGTDGSDFRISNFEFPNVSLSSQSEQNQVGLHDDLGNSMSQERDSNMTEPLVSVSNHFSENGQRNSFPPLPSENLLSESTCSIMNEYMRRMGENRSTDVPNPYNTAPIMMKTQDNVSLQAADTTSGEKEDGVDIPLSASSRINSLSDGGLEFVNSNDVLDGSAKEGKCKESANWIPNLEDMEECPVMDVKFTSVNAMESGFLLVDVDGLLWFWYNKERQPVKADFSWNGNQTIVAVGCNLLRASIIFKSKGCATFYDRCFKNINNGDAPSLITTLSHDPIVFSELLSEQIADLQCSNFFSVVQTVSGKVFWWGLTSSSERNSISVSNSAKSQESSEINVGDRVSLSKQGKNETGALIFNERLQQFGVVMQEMSEEMATQNLTASKVGVKLLHLDDKKSEAKAKTITEIWDCKDVVYLQEPNSFTGKVISLDGPYAIVQHNDTSEDREKWKVYFKSSLEKIGAEENIGDCDSMKSGRSRYQKYLFDRPMHLFSDASYTIAAMHSSEIGITILANRVTDEKTFLIFPECANFHYASWFTCAKKDIDKNEKIKSECGVTVEFESAPSHESNLCVVSETFRKRPLVFNLEGTSGNMYESKDGKILETVTTLEELEDALYTQEQRSFTRSHSLPTASNSHGKGTKRKWSSNNTLDRKLATFRKPTLISICNYQNCFTMLLDNIGCLYPIRFGSSLSFPPLLEILPFQYFMLFDRGYGQSKDERMLTLIAVPKVSPLLAAIRSGDKVGVDKLISCKKTETSPNSKRGKIDARYTDAIAEDKLAMMLEERCNGNQNIMHVAASNILKIHTQGPVYSNIMEIRNDEENAIIHMLLDNITLWPHVKKLLCERDSHGATPFMSALLMQNLRGAYLILVAVKQDGKSIKVTTPKDKDLFEKAICTPTFSGLSPLHALIHSSSKKTYSQQSFNTLKVSNLPPNYSSRLLLKLFKSRYPSVYRAVMPLPKPLWPQQNVRSKVKGNDIKPNKEGISKRGKSKIQVAPHVRTSIYRSNVTPSSGVAAAGRPQFPNRADTIRMNAKEGLVMFGNIDEMFQALLEMNNHSLLTKADHPSGALLSVVQHLLQVQLYQEALPKPLNEEQQNTVPTSKPLYGSLAYFHENIGVDGANGASTSKAGSSQDDSLTNREDTISKCFDDIMVHLLLTSLVNADPMIAAVGNLEGESALSYFVKTYPRFSPSHLHKLFLNWRPCNPTHCKYNRHVGKLSVTCITESQQSKNNDDAKNDNPLFPSEAPSSTLFNPILSRRGLQSKGNSLMINVKEQRSSLETGSSPITPSIRVLDNLKFAPIEINSGLTPQTLKPSSTVELPKEEAHSSWRRGFNPFFPPVENDSSKNGSPSKQDGSSGSSCCTCHLNKARLLWNTTFEASTFFLAKNWPCIAATIIAPTFYMKRNEIDSLSLVNSNKLDTFTENLLLNPYNVLLEVFVKTMIIKFEECKAIANPKLLSHLHSTVPTDIEKFNVKVQSGLLPWLAVHRFVRSLVRHLSLCLSKNGLPDESLKFKIGRFANKSHSKKEVRMAENLRLCLKAFSWISVLEILRAAVVMLKPIKSGTVKAQAKGIIRDIHNSGQTPLGRGGALPHGMRVHVPSSGTNLNQRSIIRNASRMPRSSSDIGNPGTSTMLQSPQVMSSQSQVDEVVSDNEESGQLDDSFIITDLSAAPVERNDSDLNEVDWNQSQGITPESSVAWAVDGHIRVRNEVSNRLLPPPGLWQFNPQNHIQQQIMNTPSVHAGYLYLARMFCRLVKEATDLATALRNDTPQEYGPNPGAFNVAPLNFSAEVKSMLMDDANQLVVSSWDWMKSVLTTLESQLKEGEKFDTKHFVLRLKKSDHENEIAGLGRPSLTHMYGSSPDEYMMYLLKQDMGEAQNTLPVLDLFSYTHMTYILDAYLYMNKTKPFSKKEETEVKEQQDATHIESDVDNDQDSLKDSSFMSPSHPMNVKFYKDALDMSSNLMATAIDDLRRRVEEKKAVANQISLWLDESVSKKPRNDKNSVKSTYVDNTEWDHVIDAFTTLFLTEGPGYERDSFLAVKAGSSGRISRFQRSLAAVRGADTPNRSYAMVTVNPENPALLINVVRSKLLEDCISIFSEDMGNHPFGCLRVRFESEEGTGPGVNRGLFVAFAAALKSGEKYKEWPVEFFAECGNLPNQRGIFSPKVGKYDCVEPPTVYFCHPMSQAKRYTAFAAIGRFLGLALWFNYTIPMIFSRPVLLYMLGREEELCFHDLAFFDSALYASFFQLITDALSSNYTDEEFMELYCFCFEISIDSHTEELVPGGKHIRVTKQNAFTYIRLYTKTLLFTCREKELQGLRDGLIQMIPKDLLGNLEPEDLQLLLSGGMEDVSYARLRSIISFSNSRGCPSDVLERYKTWFWKIVQKMSSSDRQKLLYFATGSSVLPALDNRVGNNEELSITVDIINSTTSSALPMASTCGQRISIPLYPSKGVLKHKLLQAIECQSYGLG